MKLFCFAALTILILLHDARAVVDANSSTNTSNPGDGSPWDNVGSVSGASGVYVGGGWVLTAGHVAPSTTVFSVGSFAWDGLSIRLKNPDNTEADLVMFHLALEPALPALKIAAATPAARSQVDIESNGYIRGTATTFSGRNGWTYGTTSKSWGTNRTDSGGVSTVNSAGYPTQVFTTTFDDPSQLFSSATAHEAQVADGDSGGAVFYNSASNGWELAGIVNAKGAFTNQPSNTAIYGNVSYLADIATYHDQIIAIVPEPDACWLLILAGGLVAWPVMRRR